MGSLGELLEVLHGSLTSYERVRVEYRTWRSTSGATRAMLRQSEPERWTAHAAAAKRLPDETVMTQRIWVDGQRSRVESVDQGSVAIRVGMRWWSYSPELGAVTGEDTPSSHNSAGDPPNELLRPARLMGALRFEATGNGVRLDRPVLRARAFPSERAGRWDSWALNGLGFAADEYLLEVDTETGVLLAVEGRIEGEPFQRIEATEIGFDGEFPDGLFTFQAPPGEEVRSLESVAPRPRDVSLSEAAQEAPFQVFSLGAVSSDWSVSVRFVPGRERPPAQAHVFVSYRTEDRTHDLGIVQTGDSGEPQIERPGTGAPPLRDVQIGEVPARVRDRSTTWQQSQLECVRDGTRIVLTSSAFDADKLVELAGRLEPASAHTPDL